MISEISLLKMKRLKGLRSFLKEKGLLPSEFKTESSHVELFTEYRTIEDLDMECVIKALLEYIDVYLYKDCEWGRIQFDTGNIVALNLIQERKGWDDYMELTDDDIGSHYRKVSGSVLKLRIVATLFHGEKVDQDILRLRQPKETRWRPESSKCNLFSHRKKVDEIYLDDCFNFVSFMQHRLEKFGFYGLFKKGEDSNV